jgi:hypothetical protein
MSRLYIASPCIHVPTNARGVFCGYYANRKQVVVRLPDGRTKTWKRENVRRIYK